MLRGTSGDLCPTRAFSASRRLLILECTLGRVAAKDVEDAESSGVREAPLAGARCFSARGPYGVRAPMKRRSRYLGGGFVVLSSGEWEC